MRCPPHSLRQFSSGEEILGYLYPDSLIQGIRNVDLRVSLNPFVSLIHSHSIQYPDEMLASFTSVTRSDDDPLWDSAVSYEEQVVPGQTPALVRAILEGGGR